MISVRYDPTPALSVLNAVASRRTQMKAVDAMAKSYREQVEDYLATSAPFTVSRGRKSVLTSLKWKFKGSGAMTYTWSKVALFLEGGTGLYGPKNRAYRIKPKNGKFLKFQTGGQTAFARSVKHPGISPRPFFYVNWEDREVYMTDAAAEIIHQKMKEAQRV